MCENAVWENTNIYTQKYRKHNGFSNGEKKDKTNMLSACSCNNRHLLTNRHVEIELLFLETQGDFRFVSYVLSIHIKRYA